MARTFRMRMTSIAVTVFVALTEYLLVGIPLGAILWVIGAVSAAQLAYIGLAMAIVWPLAIVLLAHIQSTDAHRLVSGEER